MAVKVTTPGILPKDIKYTATCTECMCRFEFTGDDGKTSHDQREGSFITIGCPTCNKPVHQKVRSAADEMRRRANDRVDPY